MKEVVLKVHPMTRAILLAEYGDTQPIQLGPNDVIFPLLTSAPHQEFANVKRAIPFLTQSVVIHVHPSIALGIFRRPWHFGAALYSLHKDQMCRYADCRVRHGGQAWAAIEEWLSLYGVEEDHFVLQTAYKVWQRWNWAMEKKNPQFFSRIRRKAGVNPAKKNAHPQRLKMSVSECEIEQALDGFLVAVSSRMKRTPKRFPTHARAYLYKEMGGLSEREAAAVLGMPRASVGYACRTMRNWIDNNRKVRAAWEQCAALPRCA